jgi:putative nucleotidyltransferase with HDIG domain
MKNGAFRIRGNPYIRRELSRLFLVGILISVVNLLIYLSGSAVTARFPEYGGFVLPLSIVLALLLSGGISLAAGSLTFRRYNRFAREFYKTILEFEKGNLEYPIEIDGNGFYNAVAARIRYFILNAGKGEGFEADDELQRRIFEIITVLVNAMEERDHYTVGHSNRVAKYSMIIARNLNLPQEKVKLLNQAAIIHDIGKLGIPIEIVNKPAPLNQDERLMMLSHPVRGMKILSSIDYLKEIGLVVLYHHERDDGRGYFMLPGEDVPQLSKIIAIADAYDAMRSDRPYRKALSKTEALQELARCAGSQFNRICLNAFLKAVKEFD